MPCDIQIYSPQGSNALSFVLDFVFDEFYGCGYILVSDFQDLKNDSVVINYSNERIDGAIQIVPNGYLFNSDLRQFPKIEIKEWNNLPSFFKTSGSIPFDLFAAIFLLLSRAEEYVNSKRDIHGRFASEMSVFSSEFIQRPIIDEWLFAFRKEFLLDYDLLFAKRSFSWINTYDIDVAYAYRFRSFGRVLGAAARNALRGDFKSFLTRFGVLAGKKPDPFDTYTFQKEISEKYADETIYFFLLANKSKYDRNLEHTNSGMNALIKKVESYAQVGIHPSYASGEKPELLSIETNRLSQIKQSPVKVSRQHFLRLNLPITYRRLIKNGISKDYTMGYADLPGFRSGTCTPHNFFDIEKNTTTSLRIFPLVIMESSMRDYLKMDYADARGLIYDLVMKVKAVNGVFISLWHNDSLADEKGNHWKALYLEMVNLIKRK